MILTNSCKKVLNNFIQQYTIIENQRINLHALSMSVSLGVSIRELLRTIQINCEIFGNTLIFVGN